MKMGGKLKTMEIPHDDTQIDELFVNTFRKKLPDRQTTNVYAWKCIFCNVHLDVLPSDVLFVFGLY